MRVVLIINPASGESMLAQNEGSPDQLEEKIVSTLRSYGIEPEVQHTTPEDTGAGLAKQAAEEGADIVIAAGGDGTIHAVASGLIGTKSTLGVIAMGTMNNIAHSLDLPKTIEELCEVIAKGTTSVVDVGHANGQVFLEVVGVGLEAALFPAAEEVKSRGLVSTVRGVTTALKKLLEFKPPQVKVSLDGRRAHTYKALQVTVCNTPYYGAHFQIVSNILMNDGLLDVIIYRNFSKFEFIRHAISISQGRRTLEPRITRRKVKALTIRSEQAVEAHADGVPLGTTPVRIEIEAGALQVRVPEKVASGPNVSQNPEHKRLRTRAGKTTRRKTPDQNDLNTTEEKKGALHAR